MFGCMGDMESDGNKFVNKYRNERHISGESKSLKPHEQSPICEIN